MPHHYVLTRKDSRRRYYVGRAQLKKLTAAEVVKFEVARVEGKLLFARIEEPFGTQTGDFYTDEDRSHRP